MADWRNEVRTCGCGGRFAPKREAQAYCSKRCANSATQRRKRSGDIDLVTRASVTLLARSAMALRWFGRNGTSTKGQHRVLSKATTTPSNITRTVIRSCRRVSTEGVGLCC